MDAWEEVVNSDEVKEIFKGNMSFHDAEVIDIKYDGTNALIVIECKEFIQTQRCLYNEMKQYENIYVSIVCKDITLFQMDGGYGSINDFILEKKEDKFMMLVKGSGLKCICKTVEIENVNCIRNDIENPNKLLDRYLKSNL